MSEAAGEWFVLFFKSICESKEFGLQAAAASEAPASVRRRAALHFQLISRFRLAIGMEKTKNKNKGKKKKMPAKP